LKEIVEKLDHTHERYEIIEDYVKIVEKDVIIEGPVDLEKVQAELEGMSKEMPRELLEMFGAFLERKLGQSGKRKLGDEGAMEDSAEMDVDLF
jgi:hypothetical protein